MSNRSAIEWTDATWNPVTGCTEVSPGCDHCYARTFAERFAGTPGHYFEHGFAVQLRPDKLRLPLKWRRPRRVFVNSMSDLFHTEVPDDYIARVFAVMGLADGHTFQILTKRHARMRTLLASREFLLRVRTHLVALCGHPGRMTLAGKCRVCECNTQVNCADPRMWSWPFPNVWIGVSVEDQKRAELRVPALLATPAAVRFLSCEPLLGPLDLTAALTAPARPRRYAEAVTILDGEDPTDRPPAPSERRTGVDWVIVGGESGAGARPIQPAWVRTARDQCLAADVPFFFKQWGGHTPKTGGRLLDGRTWDQMPHTT